MTPKFNRRAFLFALAAPLAAKQVPSRGAVPLWARAYNPALGPAMTMREAMEQRKAMIREAFPMIALYEDIAWHTDGCGNVTGNIEQWRKYGR